MAKPSGWLQLRCTLNDSQPEIWRDIRVPAAVPLAKLHQALQLMFSWKNYHLHDFRHQGKALTDPELVDDEYEQTFSYKGMCLHDILSRVGDIVVYNYDYGDSWEVSLQLLAWGVDDQPPALLGGERPGPPEDCGGISGHERLDAILSNPKDKEYAEMRSWVGRSYQPGVFSIGKMRNAWARLFPKARETRTASRIPDAQTEGAEP